MTDHDAVSTVQSVTPSLRFQYGPGRKHPTPGAMSDYKDVIRFVVCLFGSELDFHERYVFSV